MHAWHEWSHDVAFNNFMGSLGLVNVQASKFATFTYSIDQDQIEYICIYIYNFAEQNNKYWLLPIII